MNKRKKFLIYVVPTCISAVFLYLAVRSLDLPEFLKLLGSIKLQYLLAALVVGGVIHVLGVRAGWIHAGDGHVAVFKMESHNHPSYVEPHQGAATGVGGIMRDVFTMGARPVALLNALRFGDPSHPKTKRLVSGVVAAGLTTSVLPANSAGGTLNAIRMIGKFQGIICPATPNDCGFFPGKA